MGSQTTWSLPHHQVYVVMAAESTEGAEDTGLDPEVEVEMGEMNASRILEGGDLEKSVAAMLKDSVGSNMFTLDVMDIMKEDLSDRINTIPFESDASILPDFEDNGEVLRMLLAEEGGDSLQPARNNLVMDKIDENQNQSQDPLQDFDINHFLSDAEPFSKGPGVQDEAKLLFASFGGEDKRQEAAVTGVQSLTEEKGDKANKEEPTKVEVNNVEQMEQMEQMEPVSLSYPVVEAITTSSLSGHQDSLRINVDTGSTSGDRVTDRISVSGIRTSPSVQKTTKPTLNRHHITSR